MDILLSVFNGFIGSLLVVYYLYRLKPNVVISQNIAKNSNSEYQFKILNKTPYSLLDITIELYIVRPDSNCSGSS